MSALLEGLSDDPATRSSQILSLVVQGKAVMSMATITVYPLMGEKSVVAKLQVSSRAMTIDGIRVSVNQKDLQHIADYYGGHILTQKIADDINRLADVRIEPQTQRWFEDTPNSMARLYRMFDYDQIVSNAIGSKKGNLYANEGKDWVLSLENSLAGVNAKTGIEWKNTATNHGWYKNTGAYNLGDPIQLAGHQHDINHVDYSQLARIVLSDMEISIDGGSTYTKTTLANVLKDPKLYQAVSYNILNDARHPGVPKTIQTLEGVIKSHEEHELTIQEVYGS